jgi:hypothetical protein
LRIDFRGAAGGDAALFHGDSEGSLTNAASC